MPAHYSHTTRASGTVLTATIYNGDHQNHIDNGVPLQLDNYSINVGQMQTVTDPGEVGTESLATTLAGELERIRFVLKELKNSAQWYSTVNGFLGASRVQGLVGAPNSGTPLTKYDLAADAVVCRDGTGGTLVKLSTGTLTNDLGLAGVTANGRDQAGAFAASSWIYLYFIMKADGTIATLSSLNVPTSGPAALPTGYTHWAFAGSVRWNGSSNIISSRMRGNWNTYDTSQTALSAGSATTETTVSIAALVPPNAGMMQLNADLVGTADGSGTLQMNANYRSVTGVNFAITFLGGVLGIGVSASQRVGGTYYFVAPNVGQQFFYIIVVTTGTSQTYGVNIMSYTMPNGG